MKSHIGLKVECVVSPGFVPDTAEFSIVAEADLPIPKGGNPNRLYLVSHTNTESGDTVLSLASCRTSELDTPEEDGTTRLFRGSVPIHAYEKGDHINKELADTLRSLADQVEALTHE